MTPTYKEVKQIMLSKGYKFFTKPFSINIIGIRVSINTNLFDDLLCVLYLDDKGKEYIEIFPCTTDPGEFYLTQPFDGKATKILKEGQYEGVYVIGIHGRTSSSPYEALEQVKPMLYYMDSNKNKIMDIGPDTPVVKALVKSNIHHAHEKWTSTQVDKWSACCQVITGPENWERFIELCKKSAKLYGNTFTYTLLNKADFHAS